MAGTELEKGQKVVGCGRIACGTYVRGPGSGEVELGIVPKAKGMSIRDGG